MWGVFCCKIFRACKVKKFNVLIGSLSSDVSIVIAGLWNAPNLLAIERWCEKARYVFLMSELYAVNKCRMGNCCVVLQFCKQWCAFVKYCNLLANEFYSNMPSIRYWTNWPLCVLITMMMMIKEILRKCFLLFSLCMWNKWICIPPASFHGNADEFRCLLAYLSYGEQEFHTTYIWPGIDYENSSKMEFLLFTWSR